MILAWASPFKSWKKHEKTIKMTFLNVEATLAQP